jgi:hypothetical protein
MVKRKHAKTDKRLSLVENMSAPATLAAFLKAHELFVVCQASKKMLSAYSASFMKRTFWSSRYLPTLPAFQRQVSCLVTSMKRTSSRRIDVNKITNVHVVCECKQAVCSCTADMSHVYDMFPKTTSLSMRIPRIVRPRRSFAYESITELHVLLNSFDNFEIPIHLQVLTIKLGYWVCSAQLALEDQHLIIPSLPISLRFLKVTDDQHFGEKTIHLSNGCLPNDLVLCHFSVSLIMSYDAGFVFPAALTKLHVANLPPAAIAKGNQLTSCTIWSGVHFALEQFDVNKLQTLVINHKLPANSSLVFSAVTKLVCNQLMSSADLKSCSQMFPAVRRLKLCMDCEVVDLCFPQLVKLDLKCKGTTVDLSQLSQLKDLNVMGMLCSVILPSQLYSLALCPFSPFNLPPERRCIPFYVDLPSLANIVVLQVPCMVDVPFSMLPPTLQTLHITHLLPNWRSVLAERGFSHVNCV